jgi:ParB-like chromosome segregation protein Spo0J
VQHREVIVKTETVDINKVQPHPRNVRQGDIGAIIESIKTHGLYRPLVVQQSTGYILAGNHTWQACKRLRMKQVWVTWVDVDSDTAIRILLCDNRLSDIASYDDSELAHLLEALITTPDKLLGTGYDADDLDSLIKLIDQPQVTEVEKEKEKEVRSRTFTCPECGHEF